MHSKDGPTLVGPPPHVQNQSHVGFSRPLNDPITIDSNSNSKFNFLPMLLNFSFSNHKRMIIGGPTFYTSIGILYIPHM
jgi:hypothetical protein